MAQMIPNLLEDDQWSLLKSVIAVQQVIIKILDYLKY